MTVEDDIATFRRVPTLALLGPDALRIVAIGAETRRVYVGDVLFAEGEPGDAGYVVQQGSFALTSRRSGDREASVVRSGTLLGEFTLVTETVWPVTATARESSAVIRISRNMFLRMLEGYPEAAERLRRHLAARAAESARHLDEARKLFRAAEDKH